MLNNVSPVVRPWSKESLESNYDVAFFVLGYERRSRYLAETFPIVAEGRHAIGFPYQQACSFEENQRWYVANDFKPEIVTDENLRLVLRNHIRRACAACEDRECRILVDVSSMSRIRIAITMVELALAADEYPIVVDFVYCSANFSPPARESSPIEVAGPVLREFAGWPNDPTSPTVAVFGLGFEYERAAGVFEYLEPTEIWTFSCKSIDPRYDQESENANKLFRTLVPVERRLTYEIAVPFDCFVTLESLIAAVARYGRAVIVPFGPKIFAVCGLLVALIHFPSAAVWRVSSGRHETPVDRSADGNVTGISLRMSPGRPARDAIPSEQDAKD